MASPVVSLTCTTDDDDISFRSTKQIASTKIILQNATAIFFRELKTRLK